MFGINGPEFLILIVVALVVIGPRRLPEYAQRLRDTVKSLKRWATDVRDDMQNEMGDEFSDVDWQKLDPRQYDPRRIVREALAEDDDRGSGSTGATSGTREAATAKDSSPDEAEVQAASPLERYQAQVALRDRTRPAPFDPDAT